MYYLTTIFILHPPLFLLLPTISTIHSLTWHMDDLGHLKNSQPIYLWLQNFKNIGKSLKYDFGISYKYYSF